jgi:predicted nucleic acid-binding protein
MAENTKLVIDASIVMSWLLADEHDDRVVVLIEECIAKRALMFAPQIITYEVVNGLKTSIVRNRVSLGLAKKLLDDFDQLHLQIISEMDLHQLIELSVTHNISVYDGAYASLAQNLNAPLCTKDQKLANKISPKVKCLVF